MLQLEVIDIGREKEDCDQRHLCIMIKKNFTKKNFTDSLFVPLITK